MGMTDPIADMFTRIRNANTAHHEMVEIPTSKIKAEIAKILKEEGYIRDYQVVKANNHDAIRVKMKYGPNKERVITGIKRISKPGLRVYARKDEIPRVLGGLGVAILSTSKGLMTNKRALKEGVGGEVICFVW
ncbi:MAG: 30S ribosomal protein S8 [Actinomycetota bacterium]|nr:30S ribosomal protein S8 [Actinomycetota bacterium]